MEVTLIKLYQLQRCMTQWASKLQTAGGCQGIWEKHHSMPASFLSPPKTSAEDVTGPCGPLWPYEPMIWASTAVLVIASESVTAADPDRPPTPGLEAMDTRDGRGGHNPYIYLAPKPPRNRVLRHFRGNAGSNCPPPSPNKLLHLMLDNKAALHSHQNFWDTGSKEKTHHRSPWGCFWAGAEEESEAAAAGFCACSTMIPEECKEGEVNPACKKSVYSSRSRASTYPL